MRHVLGPISYAVQQKRRSRPPENEGEWRNLALVIQPDGLYLREWDKDVVTELGGIEIDIPHEQWHEMTIELTGDDADRVVVKQLRAGETEVDTFEADTTIPGGGNIGFGVGDEANFRFDDVGYATSDVLTATETLRYHYDANGRVVGRTLNPGVGEVSQFFIYDGDRIIQELDEGGNLVAAWDYGIYIDEIFVMYRDVDDNGSLEPYYYLQDDHYNVIGLADASGTVVERYAYDDYGAPTIYTGDGTATRTESAYGNPFLFQGRRWDEVLSLYDYRTRYYDPAIGRFLRIDTIGLWGDANNMGNPYAFVGNNPWTHLDPHGEDFVTVDETTGVVSWTVESKWFGRNGYSYTVGTLREDGLVEVESWIALDSQISLSALQAIAIKDNLNSGNTSSQQAAIGSAIRQNTASAEEVFGLLLEDGSRLFVEANAAWIGALLEKSGAERGSYIKEAAQYTERTAENRAIRTELKAKYRLRTPQPIRAYIEYKRPSTGVPQGHTSNPGKTNSTVNAVGKGMKIAGRGMTALVVAVEVYHVHKAPEGMKLQTTTKAIGRVAGAVAGGATGAGWGASAALVVGNAGPQVAAPEEFVTVPVFGVVGGLAGAFVGSIIGGEASEEVYVVFTDAAFRY